MTQRVIARANWHASKAFVFRTHSLICCGAKCECCNAALRDIITALTGA
jgi:hypothetical protein